MYLRSLPVLAAAALLLTGPASVRAGDGTAPARREAPGGAPGVLVAQAEEEYEPGASDAPAAPSPSPSAQPGSTPPAQAPAPPFADEPRTAQRSPVPPGQWVYTQQYGWIWMPYADEYTWVPPDGYGEPYAYVYYPVAGWTWIVAPWVWGVGPWPHFGFRGPVSFAWYRHGWWRSPWRWHFAPGFAFHGVRPLPPHGGLVFRGAPARAVVVPHAAPRAGGRGVVVGGGRHR